MLESGQVGMQLVHAEAQRASFHPAIIARLALVLWVMRTPESPRAPLLVHCSTSQRTRSARTIA